MTTKQVGTDTTNATPHCRSCGKQNPASDEGYTFCCNKSICGGDSRNKYGTPRLFVVACCWGVAGAVFDANGVGIPTNAYLVERL